MKKFLVILLCFFNILLANAQNFCIREKEGVPIDDPYIQEYTIKYVEKAFLEAHKNLNCNDKSSDIVYIKITNFSNVPIGYSIYQRANNYMLTVNLELDIAKKHFVYSQVSYYTLPTGGMGNLPRRQAFEDAMSRIKDNIISDLLKQ